MTMLPQHQQPHVGGNIQRLDLSAILDRAGNRIVSHWAARLAEKQDSCGDTAEVRTLPLIARLPLIFRVAESHPTAGPVTMAHAILDTSQGPLNFYDNGLQDTIPDGLVGNTARKPGQNETNIDEGGRTPEDADYAITGLSVRHVGTRAVYGTASPFAAEAVTDADVLAAYKGTVLVYDPSNLMLPDAFCSPGNLEDGAWRLAKDCCALKFEWDRGTSVYMGNLGAIPDGSPNSMLQALGQPIQTNRYYAREGWMWCGRTSKMDQGRKQFRAVVEVKAPLVVPFTIPTLLGTATKVAPTRIIMDIEFGLHGTGFKTATRPS